MAFETNPIYRWPSNEEEIWLNPYFFLHNWSSGMSVRSRWSTDISLNQNAGEIRVGLVNRPYRMISAHFTNMKRSQALDHQMMLARMGKSRFWFPLYSDFSRVTVNVTSNIITTTTSEPIIIYCDTTNRRFYANKYIALVRSNSGNGSKLPYIDILKISVVFPTYIVAIGTVSRDYYPGSRVYPLIVGKIVKSEDRESVTDQVIDGEVTVEEVIGKTSLPAAASNNAITTTYSATVSPVGLQYPILDTRPDWRDASVGSIRTSETSASGRGEILQTYGNRPLMRKTTSFSFLNRTSAFNFMKLFDSRRGRLHPLYVFSEINEYSEVYDISSDRKQISIQYTGPKVNWAFRPYVGIRLKDGTYIVRKVTDVLLASTTTFEPLTTTGEPGMTLECVRFETALPAFNINDILRLHVAYLARFDIDEIEENWVNDSLMQCTVSFAELDEKNVEYKINYYGTTTPEPTTSGSPACTCEPFFVTDWNWNGGSPRVEDVCYTWPTWTNYGILWITSGNAAGAHGNIVSWGGPSNPWYVLSSPNPGTEWDVQVGDSYEIEYPE
jgi:hypothetical protein